MAKQDLISTIPSDPAARKKLADTVKAGVQVLKDIKGAQEDLKTVVTRAKEDQAIDPKFLKTLIKFEYDSEVTAEKKRAELSAQVEQVNELDILMGRSEVAVAAAQEQEGDE